VKCYVLTVNQKFESLIIETLDAIEKGQPINLMSMLKIHTIRKNYAWWKKRIEAINQGEAYLSIRRWTGKPYRSPQHEIKRLETVGVQEVAKRSEGGKTKYYIKESDGLYFVSTGTLARNDGLSYEEFCEWFKNYPDGDMAIIHFTDFRY
jgi:hypothetical protein